MIVGQAGVIVTEEALYKRSFAEDVQERHELMKRAGLFKRDEDRGEARQLWKRDLTGRSNGTIDAWYGCDIYDAALDYAANFTYPWNSGGGFSYYNVPSALSPAAFNDASVFLNGKSCRNLLLPHLTLAQITKPELLSTHPLRLGSAVCCSTGTETVGILVSTI